MFLMDKDRYILIRQKIVRQLNRKIKQRDLLKEKILSESGKEQLNYLSGQITATENIIDIFDMEFKIPLQEKII